MFGNDRLSHLSKFYYNRGGTILTPVARRDCGVFVLEGPKTGDPPILPTALISFRGKPGNLMNAPGNGGFP